MKTTAKKATKKTSAAAAPAQEAATVATHQAKATRPGGKAKAAKKKVAAPKAAGTTKKAEIIALISRKGGATLDEIMSATGWQKHTVRGFISILNKGGAKIASSKSEKGERTYRAA